TRLGRGADVEAARTQAERAELDHRPSSPLRVRFDGALELTGVEIPPEVRAGSAVQVRYWWRALQPMPRDYPAFVRALALGGRQHLDQDHRLGEASGPSLWRSGDRPGETRTLGVPAGTLRGRYEVKLGVWCPAPRWRLPIAASALAASHNAVTVATF